MQKWKCSVCGYETEGAAPPDKCPNCGSPKECFTPESQDPDIGDGVC